MALVGLVEDICYIILCIHNIMVHKTMVCNITVHNNRRGYLEGISYMILWYIIRCMCV